MARKRIMLVGLASFSNARGFLLPLPRQECPAPFCRIKGLWPFFKDAPGSLAYRGFGAGVLIHGAANRAPNPTKDAIEWPMTLPAFHAPWKTI